MHNNHTILVEEGFAVYSPFQELPKRKVDHRQNADYIMTELFKLRASLHPALVVVEGPEGSGKTGLAKVVSADPKGNTYLFSEGEPHAERSQIDNRSAIYLLDFSSLSVHPKLTSLLHKHLCEGGQGIVFTQTGGVNGTSLENVGKVINMSNFQLIKEYEPIDVSLDDHLNEHWWLERLAMET